MAAPQCPVFLRYPCRALPLNLERIKTAAGDGVPFAMELWCGQPALESRFGLVVVVVVVWFCFLQGKTRQMSQAVLCLGCWPI